MFLLKDRGLLSPTKLQVGDRIRIRPRLGQFFVWRPVYTPMVFMGYTLSALVVRRALRLWTQDADGVYRRWLDLPPGGDHTGRDALSRIANTYGEESFLVPGLYWLETRRVTAIDGRFDYIAISDK
jgi:hypothetical protein